DRSAKIRKAAIRALGRLSQGEHLTAFLSGLIDEAPSVSREAMGALFGKVSLVSNERLWQIFCSTSHAHVKRNVLSLLERYGKWDSIYFMVKAIADPDVSVAELALLNIQGWLWRYNRTFSSPAPDQLANLGSALQDCGDLLDEKTREHLWFCLRGWR